MKQFTISLIAASLILGCAGTKPPSPDRQREINLGVTVAASLGCSQIQPGDRAVCANVLDRVDALAQSDPDAAYEELIGLSQNAAVAVAWSALHEVLDNRPDLSAPEWTAAAKSSLRAAVAGCRTGIGIPPGAPISAGDRTRPCLVERRVAVGCPRRPLLETLDDLDAA